jgi:Zn-dependent peptidase ImmA (M78 family)
MVRHTGSRPAPGRFLYANASCGHIFVRRGDILTRRRFTAAHELGHYRLHLAPKLARRDRVDAELVEVDDDDKVSESGAEALATMEREANRFAAELLMPELVCRELFDRYAGKYGPVPRFLVQHIAGDLLVSREAIKWRLRSLGLIAEDTAQLLTNWEDADSGQTD